MKLDKNYKVRVTPEQSRQIQELLFALGGGWFGGRDGKEPIMLNADYLFLHSSMVLTYAYERGNCYFENKPNYTEIQADDLLALLTDLQKSAENPLENMKLTPEFQVGDKVYFGANPKIQTIESIHTHDIKFIGVGGWAYTKKCCHATQENYERLQATFTDIDFEQPPKPLMGIELAKAMLDKGWHGVYGIGGSPNVSSLPVGDCVVVTSYSAYGVCLDHGIGLYKEFTPLDIRTGELLTEAVLDEN